MYLAYIDETKYEKKNPFFLIGGIIFSDIDMGKIEDTLIKIQYNFFGTCILTKDTELHGKDIFHGKANYKKRKLNERVNLFKDITSLIIENKIIIRLISIDVNKYKENNEYPEPEYRLGLSLILEEFSNYLKEIDDIGIVFADYEKDEITRSVLDFSQVRHDGKTPAKLERLKDTIYFTQSHHSRFLQLADIILYLANRFENNIHESNKWHEKEIKKNWELIKKQSFYSIKKFPKKRND